AATPAPATSTCAKAGSTRARSATGPRSATVPGCPCRATGWSGAASCDRSTRVAADERRRRSHPAATSRDDGDRVDLDEVVLVDELAHLDHGRCRWGAAGEPGPHLVHEREVLHVADENVQAAHIGQRAPCRLHEVLDLSVGLLGLDAHVSDAHDL